VAGRLHKPVNLLEVGGGRAELTAGRADLDAGRADLNVGRAESDAGRADLDAGRPDLDAGRPDLDAGRADLETALRSNLASALSVALLGLPADFAERELYLAIASISYTGDLRCLKYRIRSFVVVGGGGRGDDQREGSSFVIIINLGALYMLGKEASTRYLLYNLISCKKAVLRIRDPVPF
jgi:hypothetical protein